MYLGVARFDLHLLSKPGSLKEKRAVVRRLRDRIRSRVEVSAAEVDSQDLHHRAVLGVACVSADPGVARSLLEAAGQVIDSEPRVEERELEVEAW
jgi:hypothetical protein